MRDAPTPLAVLLSRVKGTHILLICLWEGISEVKDVGNVIGGHGPHQRIQSCTHPPRGGHSGYIPDTLIPISILFASSHLKGSWTSLPQKCSNFKTMNFTRLPHSPVKFQAQLPASQTEFSAKAVFAGPRNRPGMVANLKFIGVPICSPSNPLLPTWATLMPLATCRITISTRLGVFPTIWGRCSRFAFVNSCSFAEAFLLCLLSTGRSSMSGLLQPLKTHVEQVLGLKFPHPRKSANLVGTEG